VNPRNRFFILLGVIFLIALGYYYFSTPSNKDLVLIGTVDSFHLPAWPVAMIFGIDQLMDMARTATNVLGNCLATAVIARWEGELGKETPSPTVMDAVAQ